MILDFPNQKNQRNNKRKVTLLEEEVVKKSEVVQLKKTVDIVEEVKNQEKETEVLQRNNTRKDHDLDLQIKKSIENVMTDLKEQDFWILKNKEEEKITDLKLKRNKIQENHS